MLTAAFRRRTVAALVLLFLPGALLAQHAAVVADSSVLTLERIYSSREFAGESFGPAHWIENGRAYTTLEAAATGGGRDLVRYDTDGGGREVLVPAALLTPAGDTVALEVEDYAWSADYSRLLIFTNSRPVWRENTRGDYWVLDRASGHLRQLGGDAPESSLMFAKFSPDGGRVGYVRENDIYVEELESGAITRLTSDGSRTVINGTFDWVYEEEFGLRDGWRWSPDGTRIAFWQLVADSVRDFTLINFTDSLYPVVTPIQYPKAGEANSAARVGAVAADGGPTTWLALEGDPRNNYPARMDWAANSSEVVVQYLNRLQNTNRVLLGDTRTGAVTTVLVDRDSAWVYVVDALEWLDDGRRFTWVSERDGWEHVYSVSRDGSDVKLLTPGAFDVVSVTAVDPRGGWLYYIASPDNPAQRFLYRSRLDGRGRPQRLTPAAQAGTHSYELSPDRIHAFHVHSEFGLPPATDLVRLPDHRTVRSLAANATLRGRVARLARGPAEFTSIAIGDGIELNAWVMKPADFDPARRYPVLFHVYGGPGSQTVLDAWGGSNYLWHAMLTQQGYIVASVDNRGTNTRGRDFRKIVYGRLGVIETHDQARAAAAFGRLPYVDSTRMGIWGWSYGGFMSLNGLFRAPGVYRAAVAVAPVTHWKYYDNIYTERYNGLPQDNPEGYNAGSPLTYVDSLRGDLLLVHGSGDDNVHYQNSQALVNALVRANKPFQLMEYPNRNHGIFGGNTRRHLFELITRYLDEHLAAPESPALTF